MCAVGLPRNDLFLDWYGPQTVGGVWSPTSGVGTVPIHECSGPSQTGTTGDVRPQETDNRKREMGDRSDLTTNKELEWKQRPRRTTNGSDEGDGRPDNGGAGRGGGGLWGVRRQSQG